MARKWVSAYLCLLALVLSAGLIVAGFGLASGEEPPPTPRPEKLDAVLTGLLAQQKAAGEPTTGGGADKLLPLHRDEAGNIYVDVLMKSNGSLEGYASLGVTVQAVVGDVVAARIPLRSLGGLTNLASVDSMEASLLLYPSNDVGGPASGAPVFRSASGVDGSGAIVGVIDTGVDFTHGDFRNPDGTTRIKFLCDQTDPPQPADNTCPGGGSPVGGTLWTEAQINATIQGTPIVRQTDSAGHGTHVLGSAAGDDAVFGGMAPGADLIVVKAGDGSFPTTNIVSGISFIDGRAASLGLPYVINMSLGGQIGPHDGTDLMSQAINNIAGAERPGKVIAVAAGNDGGDAIHAGGNVTLGTQTRSFNLPGGTEAAFVDIWYDGQDSFGFSFTAPGGGIFGPFVPGAFFSTCFPGTHTCVQVDHTVPQAGNGDIEVLMVLSPNSGFQTIDLTGAWSFSLAGNVVNIGNFDAWIVCNGAFCDFPGGDDLSTIGQPGVAQTAITVGSFTTKDCWPSIAGGSFCFFPLPTIGDISSFSSIGHTRDGRVKPDIVAPGDVIVSTKSKDASFGNSSIAPDNQHVTLRGTSMATPHVAGAVALLLAANPTLDSAQIKGMLQSTATRDGFTGPGCGNVWGCGKLNLAPLANAAPIALDDSAMVEDGGTVTVLDSGQASVLANDSDPEAGALTATTTPVSGPSNGVLTLNANGTFSYTHDGTNTTGDSFTYQVCDSAALSRCATGTVTITVNQVPPGAPSLVSPVDAPARESFLNSATPFFRWTPSAGDVADYLLQVTSADSFNPHLDIEVVIPHPGTGHQTVSPLNDAIYRWRVVARDLALNTASSVTGTFTVDTIAPLTPTNLTDVTVDPEDLTRTFTWDRSVDLVPTGGTPGDESGVDFYNVVITGLVNIVATADDSAVLCPAGVCQFTTTLPAGRYTMRVSAVDRATNESLPATLDFRAGPTGVVSGLVVVDPVFGNTVSTPFPEIQWGPPVVLPDPSDTVDGGIKTYEVAITGDPVLAPGFNVPFTPFDSPRAFAAECIVDGIRTGVISECRSATGDGDLIIITIGGLDPPLAGGAPDGTHVLAIRIVPEVGPTGDAVNLIFTVDTTPPGVLALVSPANAPARASFLKDNTPFFDWAAPAGEAVDSYRLLVTSGDINTGPVFIDQVIAGSLTSFQAQPADDLPDGTYQWRVAASDQALNVSTSDTRTFTVDTVAPAPADLVLPLENELLNVRTPFFDWSESPATADVFDYRLLVVSGDIGIGAVVIDVVELHPKTDFVTIADLADGGYQWQVIARDKALNTASSVTRSFTIDATAPGIPNLLLLLPPNGAFLSTNTPFFEWETASGDVFNYELRVVSTGSIIAGPFVVQRFIPAPNTSDQTVTPLNDGTYVWRVIARDQAGNEQHYGVFTFTVDTVAPAPPPTLISPAGGDFISDDTPFFEWTPSSGDLDIDVFDYLLQVTSADTFNPHLDIEVVIHHPGTGHQVVVPLADALYRWRVIARDLVPNTAPSVTQTFTVDTVPPAPPELLAPDKFAGFDTKTVSFTWNPSTSDDIVSYRLQVTSGDIDTPPFDVDKEIAHPITGDQVILPAAGRYRWRVGAKDNAGNEVPRGDLGVRKFTIVDRIVDLRLVLESETVVAGSTFGVSIQVEPNGQPVGTVSGLLNFSSGDLDVVNVTAGTTLEVVHQNTFNNSTGVIDFTATTFGEPPTGDFNLAVVTFRAKKSTDMTKIEFNATLPRRTEAAFAGVSVLRDVFDLSVTIGRLDGDADENSLINEADLRLVVRSFGIAGDARADLNEDTVVDILDLVLVALNFGPGGG